MTKHYSEATFTEDKARLLELLRRDGIYYGSPEKPILSRDEKTTARWMLDSLCVSLTHEGINLAGRCLLKLLEKFNGRTLATYGTIGIPLLTSCILQSGGRFEGLLVRKQVKRYGSRKLIEGRINKDEPVIIIDDSVSSGLTMTECTRKLEAEGFRVEGGICLVRFGWYGGFARMQGNGYHMESLFDIWDDFMYHMDGEPDAVPNPTLVYPEIPWHSDQAPEGLHPAILARTYIEEFLRTGKLLRSPKTLDQETQNYDCSGGVWVSVRPRQQILFRHARDGVWHFPGETAEHPGKEIAIASYKTALALKKSSDASKLMETSAVAVTFFPAMEECTVGQLDNNRYGIVVRSRERLSVMGGALPRMPGISNSWMQFRHARTKNGKMLDFEPFQLLRHDVFKVVEPGIQWQPTGVPKSDEIHWYEDPGEAGVITRRVYDLTVSNLRGALPETAPLPEDFQLDELDSVFVSVYLDGRLRGCCGSKIRNADEDLNRLCRLALTDQRFTALNREPEKIAVTVSFLWNPIDIGAMSAEEVMNRCKLGEQSLMAFQGQKNGILLPFAATTFNLSRVGYATEVIDKAGITRPPYNWRRFECKTWLGTADTEPQMLVGMFPPADPPESPNEFLPRYGKLLADYLLLRQHDNGSLFFSYSPFKDALLERYDLPRMTHGCWIMNLAAKRLERSDLGMAADKLLDFLLTFVKHSPGNTWMVKDLNPPSVSEISFLSMSICRSPHLEKHRSLVQDIAKTLWFRIDNHGKVDVFRDPVKNVDSFQDYFPGQLLLSLAEAVKAGLCSSDLPKLDRAFQFYRHRFRYKRDFGQVSWMMQAFSEWWFITGSMDYAAFVFEIAQWVMEYQDHQEGGFLNEHQPETPGFTTALYIEGLAAAAKLADAIAFKYQNEKQVEKQEEKQEEKQVDNQEDNQEEKYELLAEELRDSCYRGLQFMDRLIIQERDFPLLPNPAYALGGVREAIQKSHVRTDFVQHTLAAVLALLPGQTILE